MYMWEIFLISQITLYLSFMKDNWWIFIHLLFFTTPFNIHYFIIKYRTMTYNAKIVRIIKIVLQYIISLPLFSYQSLLFFFLPLKCENIPLI